MESFPVLPSGDPAAMVSSREQIPWTQQAVCGSDSTIADQPGVTPVQDVKQLGARFSKNRSIIYSIQDTFLNE